MQAELFHKARQIFKLHANYSVESAANGLKISRKEKERMAQPRKNLRVGAKPSCSFVRVTSPGLFPIPAFYGDRLNRFDGVTVRVFHKDLPMSGVEAGDLRDDLNPFGGKTFFELCD